MNKCKRGKQPAVKTEKNERAGMNDENAVPHAVMRGPAPRSVKSFYREHARLNASRSVNLSHHSLTFGVMASSMPRTFAKCSA